MTGTAGSHRALGENTKPMSESNDFILERAIATRAAQFIITATWQWDEQTVAQWDADIAAFIAQKELVSDKEAIKTGDAGDLDAKLDILHDRTQVGLTLFKVKNRDNSSISHALKPLRAEGRSRGNILEEALEFESQWEKWEPAWVPRPTETLAAFKTLREECLDLKEPYATSKGVWRKEAEDYNQLGIALNKLCKAWYEAATTLFAEGTAEGDMIRGTVPTTYNPPGGPVPGQPVISSAVAIPGAGYHLDFSLEEGAESFEVWGKAPGETVFSLLEEGNVSATYEATGQALGDWQFVVYARNASGRGPASEVATVTVA